MTAADGQFTAHFPSMQAAAETMTIHANALMQQLEDLDQQLRPLIAVWDSAAKEAYYTQQLAWSTAMNDIQYILSEVGIKMNQAYEDFLHTEINNAAMWDGSTGGM
jgi:WXG100 family type VII secretion target